MIRRPLDRPQEPHTGSVWGNRLVNFLLVACMACWMASYTPDPTVIVAVPGLVCWFLLIERCHRTKHAVGWTFLFGAVLIAYGYRWLAPTIQLFGGIPAVWSWMLTALFGAAGILHGCVFIVIYRAMLRSGRRPHPLTTTALMVALEHMPLRIFPWKIGHGAVNCPPLVQAAEWGGVSAVTFVLLCLIVPIHEWIRWAFARSGPEARPRAALVTFVIGCTLFGLGHLRYKQVLEEEAGATRSITVGIVQPNVGSTTKREAERHPGRARRRSVAGYELGSRKAAAAGAELIVWPETAITNSTPLMLPKHDALRTNGYLSGRKYGFLNDIGRDHAFLVGIYERIPGRDKIDGRKFDERYNAAGLREAGGRDARWQVYRKVYLIPFGEYIPIPGLDPQQFLPQKFTMRAGSTEGDDARFSGLLTYRSQTLKADVRIAPFLCYEGILPEHIRNVCKGERPDVMASLTNDSWFGDTWEPHQHLNFTRFRAVEHRAPLVRATNTGISAFISPTGEVHEDDRLGVGASGVLVRKVKLVDREPTIYVRFGHWFPWLMAILALLALIAAAFRGPIKD